MSFVNVTDFRHGDIGEFVVTSEVLDITFVSKNLPNHHLVSLLFCCRLLGSWNCFSHFDFRLLFHNWAAVCLRFL